MTDIDLGKLIDEQKTTGLQIGVVAVCAAVAFCDSFSIQAVNYAGPVLRESLSLSTAQLGTVFSCSLLGMMLGSFAIGPVGDRFGRRLPMALLTIAFGVITACTALSTEFWHLLAFRLLDGLALGAALPNANVLAAEFSPKRRRRLILGLVAIGYTCGGFLAGAVGGPLIAQYGWQTLFLIGGGLAVVTGLIALAIVPESLHALAARDLNSPRLWALMRRISSDPLPSIARIAKSAEPPIAPFRSLLGARYRGLTICLWLAAFLASIDIYFFLSWTPVILSDAGMMLENAISITAMFNLGLVVAAISIGWLMDRYEPRHVLIGTAIFAGVAMAAMSRLVEHQSLLGVASLLIGAGLGGIVGGVNMVAATSYLPSGRVTGAAWTLGVGRLGSVFGPAIGAMAISGGLQGPEIYLWAIIPTLGIAIVACFFPRGV